MVVVIGLSLRPSFSWRVPGCLVVGTVALFGAKPNSQLTDTDQYFVQPARLIAQPLLSRKPPSSPYLGSGLWALGHPRALESVAWGVESKAKQLEKYVSACMRAWPWLFFFYNISPWPETTHWPLSCSAPGDRVPPCGRAASQLRCFGPEISCGTTCFI
jgi:hypothetical protein